ncbi:hypothetical protein BU26DRAFT_39754 [Trematosphaeria pertusa]|uniref:Uncharacterized protein n=1 Tax=Trematosphaeria pertusa TaxID=390896 RepID=A0A6A6J3H5_9PLEO|nr:uncharacterized protein BU26DRAFT_39754 [Trematosphaeria pertusa]KAF2257259.1 hypothetical protein BU26DRAFT_39754 [Trematosphaeria pertusa]
MTKPQKPQPGWPARIAKRTKKGIEGRIAQGQQRATRQIPDVIVNPLAPLPDELILEIFEQLIRLWELGSRGTMRIVPATTFAALALSCRYLYPFAMRFLYSTYHASLEAPLISFLRTIASQPHLVMRIKDIQTTDLRDDDYFDGCTLSRTTEAMAAEIQPCNSPTVVGSRLLSRVADSVGSYCRVLQKVAC